LYFVKAEILARLGRMPEAFDSLKSCVMHAEPGADENSPAYIELARQLSATHEQAIAAHS
jgi:hypothetical protein